MGNFRINGSSLSIPDPEGGNFGAPIYGYKGKYQVFNQYESMTLTWATLTNSEWKELNSRIISMSGQHLSCTIPGRTTDWRTKYCHMGLPTTGSGTLNYRHGVTVEVTRISDTQD
jgi:hypothetical protein